MNVVGIGIRTAWETIFLPGIVMGFVWCYCLGIDHDAFFGAGSTFLIIAFSVTAAATMNSLSAMSVYWLANSIKRKSEKIVIVTYLSASIVAGVLLFTGFSIEAADEFWGAVDRIVYIGAIRDNLWLHIFTLISLNTLIYYMIFAVSFAYVAVIKKV